MIERDGNEYADLATSEPSDVPTTSRCRQLGDEGTRSKVAGIFARARKRNLARAAELASWLDRAQCDGLSSEDRVLAAEVAHQLAGSAGTFGYQSATDLARDVERLFTEGDGERHWDLTCKRIDELTARLTEAPELDDQTP
jgi:HPt (histidine-containing phosphotransfer) domain-containing protein